MPGRRAEFDKSGSHVEPDRREPLKIHEEEALHDSVAESSAHKMGVQVPSGVDTEVPQEEAFRRLAA